MMIHDDEGEKHMMNMMMTDDTLADAAAGGEHTHTHDCSHGPRSGTLSARQGMRYHQQLMSYFSMGTTRNPRQNDVIITQKRA